MFSAGDKCLSQADTTDTLDIVYIKNIHLKSGNLYFRHFQRFFRRTGEILFTVIPEQVRPGFGKEGEEGENTKKGYRPDSFSGILKVES